MWVIIQPQLLSTVVKKYLNLEISFLTLPFQILFLLERNLLVLISVLI